MLLISVKKDINKLPDQTCRAHVLVILKSKQQYTAHRISDLVLCDVNLPVVN